MTRLCTSKVKHCKYLISMYLRGRQKRFSDDNDELHVLMFFFFLSMFPSIPKPRYYLPSRTMWLDYRQKVFWEEICTKEWMRRPDLLDSRWTKEFRMTHRQFYKLVEMLSPFITKQKTFMRDPIPNDKVLAIVLHRLGYAGSVYIGGHYLGVSAATTSKFTHKVCQVLVQQFYNRYIQIPEADELQNIMSGFENLTGVPYMWGAIDGSHIRLTKKPTAQQVPADYFNRLKFHSILLQGVCDHRRRFLNVCIQAPGGCHDAAHLRSSTLWRMLLDDQLPHNQIYKVNGKNIQPYLLGDSAYPLRIGLMKCYNTTKSGDPKKDLFDRKWRAGRVKIENAFGILKMKFQILQNLNVKLEYAPTVVTACCILHNFLIEEGDIGSDDLDKEPNFGKAVATKVIPEAEKTSENVAKQYRDVLFENWSKEKYKRESLKLRRELAEKNIARKKLKL